MKIYLSDISDVIVCECGLVLNKSKVCTTTTEFVGTKKGKCPICKKELIDYGED